MSRSVTVTKTFDLTFDVEVSDEEFKRLRDGDEILAEDVSSRSSMMDSPVLSSVRVCCYEADEEFVLFEGVY